ncbi:MarR family winged helix-turn-helix transcriptional regulator [Frigidibacter sp. ROC022]|uniref:MarR family winged helix-turn-helix transcriptional regulator n=1 Tax=Frigidibacter sp. ROC022 TaxID=2971796 RepID=UPI00215B3A45|nr:MarR family winged helix-turn-helix transcriptional regulator [Frigidibacter sp. ROC022]MCR8724773.1 MarR family winged helix-turn-helix transcriptional regulator [Frigidibacter sp. ROC022]
MSDFVLSDQLLYQVNVLAGRLSRAFAARYKAEIGLTVPEWRVLAHLSQASSVSIREIVQKVEMEKSRVSRAVSRLEAAGYVSKAADERDKRLVALALTPSGREMFQRLVPMTQAFEAEITAQLGDRADAFRDGLRVLLDKGDI